MHLFLRQARAAKGRFCSLLGRVERLQRQRLASLLRRDADTAFGREHGFSGIESYEDYRERVPLIRYEDLEPWVERIASGEPGVLTQEPVQALVPTSGTTGRKLIPHTASLRGELRRALLPWIGDLVERYPGIRRGRWYWSMTPPLPTRGDGPVPIGAGEDEDYFTARQRRFLRGRLLVPEPGGSWRRDTLVTLVGARDLSFLSVWSPTLFSVLLDGLEEEPVPVLERLPTGDRRTLELALEGDSPAETLWPSLALVSCWDQATARPYAAALAGRLPHAALQGKGLLSTEGVTTIPLSGGQILAVDSHVYEFADERGAHPCWALEVGREYRVVLTTSGGLHRYDTRDVVRVEGHAGQAPILTFLGRADPTSDHHGEKLHERHVCQALERLLPEGGFVLLAPSRHRHYILFHDRERSGGIAHRVDEALRENPQYALARDLGQLGPVISRRVSRGHQRYLARCVAEGQRLGDIKARALDARTGWESWMGVADD